MKIIIDSREQLPFTFGGKRYEGVIVQPGTLATGDYSLGGLEDKIAIERKSLDDLIGCLTTGRARFERELQRAAAFDAFAVVVGSSWAALLSGNYRSRMNPHAAAQSVTAFMARYRIPFIFAGDRLTAEYLTYSFLQQYLQGATKRLAAITKAHGGDVAASQGLQTARI